MQSKETDCNSGLRKKAELARERRGLTYKEIAGKIEEHCGVSGIYEEKVKRAVKSGFKGAYSCYLQPFAEILDVPIDLFLDSEIDINDFEKFILGSFGTIYDRSLRIYKNIDDLKKEIAKRHIEKKDILEYVLSDTNPKGLRQKSVKLFFVLGMEEEYALEISKSKGVKTALVKGALRNIKEAKRYITEKVIAELFKTISTSFNKHLIELVDKLVNEEKAFDSSVFKHAIGLNRENRIRCIQSIKRADDGHRFEMLSLQKQKDFWTVRDEIAEFLYKNIKKKSFFSKEDMKQCEALMIWVVNGANWRPDKNAQQKKLRFSMALKNLRKMMK